MYAIPILKISKKSLTSIISKTLYKLTILIPSLSTTLIKKLGCEMRNRVCNSCMHFFTTANPSSRVILGVQSRSKTDKTKLAQ